MKRRVSATVDKEIVEILDRLVQTGVYRNRSHAIEVAIKLLKKKEDGEK